MAGHGAFDGVDAALMVHPFTYDIAEPVFLGRRQLRATFTGITSHASAQPFMGRNALDAVNLTYTGVALHRQQMPPTDRVHGIVTAGGERPNVIPERAEILFYLRSEHPEGLPSSARGSPTSRRRRPYDRLRGRAAGTRPRPTSPSAATDRCRGLDAATASAGARSAPGVVPSMFAGSTDFGNVSYRVPGVHAMVRITDADSRCTRVSSPPRPSPRRPTGTSSTPPGRWPRCAADYLCDPDLRAPSADDFEAAGGAVDVPSYFGEG